MELDRRNVHGGFADCVGRRETQLIVSRQVDVAEAGRYGDDLLLAAFEDERYVDVEEMDVSDDVDFEAL